jgi:DNA-binding NarL/FixJ family response regulator
MLNVANNGTMRVAIIEENAAEREYLAGLVGSTPGVAVSAAYSGMEEALSGMAKAPAALVLVDLDTLHNSGENAFRELRAQWPHTPVLVLSSSANREQLFRTLEEGVSGWLDKPCQPDQLARAILMVQEGGAVLSNQAARIITQHFTARGLSIQSLSTREREVLGYLSERLDLAEIARRLGVTQGTIRSHIHKILLKLGVKSQTEALAKYLNPSPYQVIKLRAET